MALPNVSSFPVNLPPTQSKREKPAKLEDLQKNKVEEPARAEEDKLAIKSLQITSDPRFQEIKHHTDVAKHGSAHLARLVKNRRYSHKNTGKEEDRLPAIQGAQGLSFQEIVQLEEQSPDKDEERKLQSGVADRLRWQESFNRNVNQLLIDFDLSLNPECRLNHLDRMHDWFTEHGGKQQRKDKKAPNFVTADRNNMPAGSTANISSKLSGTSLILAGSYALKTPRTPRDVDRLRTPR